MIKSKFRPVEASYRYFEKEILKIKEEKEKLELAKAQDEYQPISTVADSSSPGKEKLEEVKEGAKR